MRLLSIVMVVLLLLYVRVQPCKAGRVLHEEETEWMKKGDDHHIVLESLQKGPVTPSGPSGCTNIPGSGGTHCPIKEMNFAGGGLPHAAAYPHVMLPFAAATHHN